MSSNINFEDIFQSDHATLVTDSAFDHVLSMDSTSSEPRQLEQAGAYADPAPAPEPTLIGYSHAYAELLDFKVQPGSSDQLKLLSGSAVLSGTRPYAMNYAGHQFGNWAGQLGDGRALNLFEIAGRSGRYALQLKGAGPTAFSRRGDGFAVLRSSIREFLCSEAMHALGVPTTRALSLIDRGEPVWRDMFYDGRPKQERSAVVCRVAPSFIRFGHFELWARRGDKERLRQLLEFTLQHYFSDIAEHTGQSLGAHLSVAKSSVVSTESVNRLFARVCETTVQLLIHWQTLGFTHGVLNTDNMSIHGITLDYGPFGWLESYDPAWTPNTTDAQRRRYAFGQQPQIALWNLWQLANALATIVENADGLSESLAGFQETFEIGYRTKMQQKLGVERLSKVQLDLLEKLLQKGQVDMTIFFRGLADVSTEIELKSLFEKASYLPTNHWVECELFQEFAVYYFNEIQMSDYPKRKLAMNKVNPCYVPRNYLLYEAIQKAEKGDYGMVHQLQKVWSQPYLDQGYHELQRKRPEWAMSTAGCSELSCSS